MRELFTHEEVEQALIQLGWKPLTKRGGWRRYFKSEQPTLAYGLPTIAKLPARSYVDAPKPIILDFVRTVNKRENRNVFCCWWLSLHQYSTSVVLLAILVPYYACYRIESNVENTIMAECLHVHFHFHGNRCFTIGCFWCSALWLESREHRGELLVSAGDRAILNWSLHHLCKF